MKLLTAIVILAVISLLGSRLTFLNRRLPMGFRHILFTGTEYIFIGILLGYMGLNILDSETLLKLDSFLLLSLAWIGFLYGLQFEIRLLKKLPKFYFSITAIQSGITFIIVGGFTYGLMKFLLELPGVIIIPSAVTLGAVACCTAQSAIAIVNRNYRINNRRLLELIRYISSVDGIFALIFFAVALSIFPGGTAGSEFGLWVSLEWLSVSILIGGVPGIVLIFLSRIKFAHQEYMLYLIGTILFCGGMAQQLFYSPLVSGLVCGVITANLCRHRLRALQIAVQAEKSIYILLLVITGALWHFQVDISLMIGIFYFLIRIAGKLAGGFIATRIFKPKYEVPPYIGLSLVSEGGLVIAIIINFRFLYPSIADSLTTIVVLSVFASEFVSPRLILSQFKQNEIELKKGY
jgi:Kef-type K+ transport system membrane component KefB